MPLHPGARWLSAAAVGQTALFLLLYILLSRWDQRRYGGSSVESNPDDDAPSVILSLGARLRAAALSREPWPHWVGGVLIAIFNTVLLVATGKPWGITSELTISATRSLLRFLPHVTPEAWYYFAETGRKALLSTPSLARSSAYANAAVVAGSMCVSIILDEFRLRIPRSPRTYLVSLAGGVLMGYGSRLALGCTVGAVLGGIPSLSLHGWVFLAGLFIGAHLANRVLLASLRKRQSSRIDAGTRS